MTTDAQSPRPQRGDARLRQAFWLAFKAYMARHSRVPCARATSEDWMNHSAGLNGGALFSVQRSRLQEIGVQFALDDATSATIYSYLESRRREIDASFGPGLRWHDPQGRRTSLIEIRRHADTSRRDDWEQQFGWLQRHLEHFQDVLWPVVGRVPPVGQPRRWDEAAFFAALSDLNQSSVAPARQILEGVRHLMPDTYWGRGRQIGACTPRLRIGDTFFQLFSLTTGGTIVLRFVDLKDAEPFRQRVKLRELVDRLNQARFLDLPDEVVAHRPALPLPLFADDAARSGLLETAAWFVQECRPAWSR